MNDTIMLLKIYSKVNSTDFQDEFRPETFDTRYLSNLKCNDSELPEDKIPIESWKQDWFRDGVQVPNPDFSSKTQSSVRRNSKSKATKNQTFRKLLKSPDFPKFSDAKHLINTTNSDGTIFYTADTMDKNWIDLVNEERKVFDLQLVELSVFERLIDNFERRSLQALKEKTFDLETQALEFDENACCNICRAYDGEDGNELVFCDGCFVCVHQACYGILKIPEGSWLCDLCSNSPSTPPSCALCPNTGGAMKLADDGSTWCHVSCALWVPEVGFKDVDRMEPIEKLNKIPQARKQLTCTICRTKNGAPIQCAIKKCNVAFHVTCAFKVELLMQTDLVAGDVRLKAYCPKHSKTKTNENDQSSSANDKSLSTNENICDDISLLPRFAQQDSPTKSQKLYNSQIPRELSDYPISKNEKLNKISELHSRFYEFIVKNEVISSVNSVLKRLSVNMACYQPVTESLYDIVFNYWKLRRRFNFNLPLIRIPPSEWDIVSPFKEEKSLYEEKLIADCIKIRQTLDRSRLMADMIIKREKKKLNLLNKMLDISDLQLKPLTKIERVPPDLFEHLSVLHIGSTVFDNPILRTHFNFEVNSKTPTQINPADFIPQPISCTIDLQSPIKSLSSNNIVYVTGNPVVDMIPADQFQICTEKLPRLKRDLCSGSEVLKTKSPNSKVKVITENDSKLFSPPKHSPKKKMKVDPDYHII